MSSHFLPYPIRTRPVQKSAVWGGARLHELFAKPAGEHIGESWELSLLPDGESVADNGPLAGERLSALFSAHPAELGGRLCPKDSFPLLFKLIDARDRLSVQVHPDDALAAEHGLRGKTEMWIVLDAAPGAGLYAGFSEETDSATFARAIRENTLAERLRFLPVTAGDVLFIPAGMVHAIGAGTVLAEIQQSSDITYRAYDWGRLGLDGKPRELHIEQALRAANGALSGRIAACPSIKVGDAEVRYLPACPYFGGREVNAHGRTEWTTRGDSFHILFLAKGDATVSARGTAEGACGSALRAHTGDTLLVPAAAESYSVTGDCRYYDFFLPEFDRDYTEPLMAAGTSLAGIRALRNL